MEASVPVLLPINSVICNPLSISLSHARNPIPAGERRKTESMLAMAESMLNLDSGATATGTATTTAAAPAPSANTTTAPKLPLRESLSSANNERSSRSSAGSGADKALKQVRQAPATPAPATSKLLSGQQQDAVVAKIRSAAKRSASPEKKLPYQDDDTPNTKGARLKKEMEVGFSTAVCRIWTSVVWAMVSSC